MKQPEQIKQEMLSKFQVVKAYLTKVPAWRWKVYGAVIVVIAVYLAWLKWGADSPKPGSVTTSVPVASQIAKMETKTVYVPQLVVIKDKAKAVEKLKLPESEATNPKEELLTATAIQRNRYGATTAVFVNTSTGQARTDIVYKPAPWFEFRNDWAFGGGYGIGTEGKVIAGRVRWDVLQVKAVTVSPEIEINNADRRNRPTEGRAMIWLEYRR